MTDKCRIYNICHDATWDGQEPKNDQGPFHASTDIEHECYDLLVKHGRAVRLAGGVEYVYQCRKKTRHQSGKCDKHRPRLAENVRAEIERALLEDVIRGART